MARLEPFRTRVTDLGERFRPQREWGEGRGFLLVLAHFLTGSGAGSWLFSVPFGFDLGLVAGFVLVALGGVAHLLFLGHPERFWRMVTRFASSWISRGLVGMLLFTFVALAYLALVLLGSQGTVLGKILLLLSLLGALWIVVYKGFVWASSKGIPLWNTPLVPALYITYALRGGTAVLMLLAPLVTVEALGRLELIKLWLLVSTAALVLIYLDVMRGSGITAMRSVDLLLFGRVSLPFYLGVVILGLVVPIAIASVAYARGVPVELLSLLGLSSLLGDLAIIYCIARAGLYRPLPA